MSGPDDAGDPDDAADGDTEAAVVEALTGFGFSTYEAGTFIVLRRLGVGFARDDHEVSDAPRPQVYGAAASLAEVD